jgi:hypothetical protein
VTAVIDVVAITLAMVMTASLSSMAVLMVFMVGVVALILVGILIPMMGFMVVSGSKLFLSSSSAITLYLTWRGFILRMIRGHIFLLFQKNLLTSCFIVADYMLADGYRHALTRLMVFFIRYNKI